MTAELLNLADLAKVLRCTPDDIVQPWLHGLNPYPEPVDIAGLKRWRAIDVQLWINQGCPSNHINHLQHNNL